MKTFVFTFFCLGAALVAANPLPQNNNNNGTSSTSDALCGELYG